MAQKPTGFLYHIDKQIHDVIIEKSNNDIKNQALMQKLVYFWSIQTQHGKSETIFSMEYLTLGTTLHVPAEKNNLNHYVVPAAIASSKPKVSHIDDYIPQATMILEPTYS